MYVYRSSQWSSQHRTRLAYYNKSKVGTIVAPGALWSPEDGQPVVVVAHV